MHTTPFPEPESPELERYQVYSRMEIVALLTQLRDEKTLVTAYYGPGSDFAVTILLAVEPQVGTQAGSVTLDDVSDAAAQRRLLGAGNIRFVAYLQNIKLQFTSPSAEPVEFDGRPAFQVALPDQLLRLQRRESYRVKTPVAKPATVLVPRSAGSNEYESLRLIDVSLGGAALMEPEHFKLEIGAAIENCFLDLPGIGSVQVGLRVRHVEALGGNGQGRRCGCEFLDPSPQGKLMLQRYVNQLDVEHRRLAPARRG